MKPRILFPIVLILVIAVAGVMLALWPRQQGGATILETSATNARTAIPQPAPSEPTVERYLSNTGTIAAAINDARILALSPRAFYQEGRIDRKLEWKMPISFWGRVVDERDQPVIDANARFVWNDTSENGTSEANTTSDGNGLFSLTGRRGKGLQVTVAKDGYYGASSSRQNFEYAQPEIRFVPDRDAPVVFHLVKKGTADTLVVMRGTMNVPGVGKQFVLATNGTVTKLDLLQAKAVQEGGHVEIQYWADRSSGRPYAWHCRIHVPSGGILMSTNEFDFNAPSEGYQPNADIEMSRDSENWAGQLKQKYIMRFADGKYGRMTFAIYADRVPFCAIESFVNPSGSSNLEDDPAKEVKAGN